METIKFTDGPILKTVKSRIVIICALSFFPSLPGGHPITVLVSE